MGKVKNQYACALVLVQSLIGGKWKLRILWHIQAGHNRFSTLKRNMPEISEKVLAEQLQDLIDNGLIRRKMVSDKPLIVEYSISEQWPQLPRLTEELCGFAREYASHKGIEITD